MAIIITITITITMTMTIIIIIIMETLFNNFDSRKCNKYFEWQ
jgi:hypothetical protein